MKCFNGKKIFFYLFFVYLTLIPCQQTDENTKTIFQCGDDNIEPIRVPDNNIQEISDNNILLDSDGFKEYKIYLDLENFNHEAEQYGLTDKLYMFQSGMQSAVRILKTLLKVKPVKNYAFTNESLTNISINYWDTSKIGTENKNQNKGMVDVGVDLYIFAKFGNKSSMGENILASAGARYIDNENGQPLIGVININKDINYTKLNSLHYFQGIMLHELTHILGFSNKFFNSFFNHSNIFCQNNTYNKIKGYIKSPKVLKVAKKYYNCDSIEGIELEESRDSGNIGSHWEERILLGDYMNRAIYPEEQVISEFTLALLEDIGFYKANYFTGGLMKYGKNKGCEFLTSKCVNDSKIGINFKNEFFEMNDLNNFVSSCSSGRQSRTYHSLYEYNNIPDEYQYYSNNTFGGRSSANYCPVSQEVSSESQNIFYVGHCSNLGAGEYGSKIPYNNPDNNEINYYKSGDLITIINESYSDNSFCVLSSLISTSVNNYQFYSSKVRAVCYQMHCSDQSLTIQINNDFIVCPRQGGKINATNFNGYLLCPDYYLICSGTVLCNDMFDCVEKKSSLKEDIVYNYEIKTSQDIEEAEKESFSENNYELSENGKCPKFCFQCDDSGKCKKCKSGYGIIELTENEITTRNCKLLSELIDGYYNNEEIYYKCIDNCKKCNNTQCIKCDSGYIYENNKCLLEIQNCSNYDDDGKCTKCKEDNYKPSNNGSLCKKIDENCAIYNNTNNNCSNCEKNYRLSNGLCYKDVANCKNFDINELCVECQDNFALEEDKQECKNITNDFEEYYTKDNIKYWKCDGVKDSTIQRIPNCRKCEYIEDDLICNECKSDYILKDDENDICYLKANYDNNSYYNDTLFHINTCSKSLINCEECEKNDNELNCIKCEKNYRKSKDKTCIKEIENCEEYDENDICIKCKQNFGFEENDKTICKDINLFDEYYLENNTYWKCDDRIPNCRKCEYNDSQLICTECKSNYILKDNENDKCYNEAEFNNSDSYYLLDSFHVKSCSSFLDKCAKCKKNNDNEIHCTECIENYSIIIDITQSCNETTQLENNKKYYKEGDIYYSCGKHNIISFCKECTNNNTCDLCQDGYEFISNEDNINICKDKNELTEYYLDETNSPPIYKKCSDIFNNCKTCSKDNCISCIDKYGLYKDKLNCIKIDEQKYYQNSDKLYYPCNEAIDNCEKCSSSNVCNKCIDGYAKLNNNHKSCIPIKDIDVNRCYVDPKDSNNYLYCSSYIKNCYSCTYLTGCEKCENKYILLNGDTKTCHEKSKIDLKTYFTDDEVIYYDCNDYRYKNNVKCFSKMPKQKIVLTFVQVQIINFKIVCFMITHSPLPKDFSLKLKVNIVSSKKKIRNLEEKEVILTNTDGSNGNTDTIVSFYSSDDDEQYSDDNDNIQVKEMNYNAQDSTTKEVTDNSDFTLNFNSSSELADTGKVKQLIAAKKIVDCSQIQQEDIVSLNMVNLDGCKFSLVPNDPVSFNDDSFDLELIQYDNNENIVIAKCDTKNDNLRIINCLINDEANSNYTFKDGFISESNKFMTLSSDDDNFNISCKNSKKKTIIIIVIVSICIVVILAITITIIVICKRKNKKGKKINITIPSKSLSNKKNILTTSIKLNTQTEQEKGDTGDVLNMGEKKKKNKNKKSKPKTKKSKSKEKKKKSKSKEKNKKKE